MKKPPRSQLIERNIVRRALNNLAINKYFKASTHCHIMISRSSRRLSLIKKRRLRP